MRSVMQGGNAAPQCELISVPQGTRVQVDGYKGELALDEKYAKYNSVLATNPFNALDSSITSIRLSNNKLVFQFYGLMSGSAKFSKTAYFAVYKEE